MNDAAREEMVRFQIERRGVTDPRVLDAMRRVPREAFVPRGIRHRALDDGALPIACGQTISQPYVVAAMVAALRIDRQARVLEIGAGSGYAAAVLATIAAEVWAIERQPVLAAEARDRLARLGYENVHVREGDGSVGWPEAAPYDAILVSAGAPQVPVTLVAQLGEDGRLVVPVGQGRLDQRILRVTLGADGIRHEESLGAVRFVPLVGAEGWPGD